MSRGPAVAGQFYELEKEKLKEQVRGCFLSKFGPGKMPGKRSKKLLGAVCPHAGYQFSGPAAAFAYKEIGESPVPDVYVILGTSHSGLGTCISMQDWETPLGKAAVDRELGRILSKKIPVNEEAHVSEHSIEVQLPFLQFVNEGKEFKILPILVSHGMNYIKTAAIIKGALKESGKSSIVIASSDFTHYGYAYGYMPFTAGAKKSMYALDRGAIEFIKKIDSGGFLGYVEEKEATICGAIPIAVLMNAVSAKKAKLLKYYTSGDVTGDYSSAVGYASIAFY